MIDNKIITVTRDCDAVLVPVGDKVKLLKGTKVRITQSLGGDYTLNVGGNLVKISGLDSDAIGIDLEIDEKILGGLIVKIGSKMIDSSLLTRLKLMQSNMSEV